MLAESGIELKSPESPSGSQQKIEEMLKIAGLNIKKAYETERKYYNLRRRNWQPEIGELVYAKEHHESSAAEKFTAKLAPKYSGPFRITDFMSPTVVKIVMEGTKDKPVIVHTKDLKAIPE